ncbi:kelch repeat-containing protein [Nocardioides sp. 616]|uniref:Kelch repeat-containing protein n=1 Tax=Nocardioides sp. 616 TaxID=2268090 RepID=UPI000CE49993|nr:kelch repeat-containing protein [Nocardioides sp. 616]
MRRAAAAVLLLAVTSCSTPVEQPDVQPPRSASPGSTAELVARAAHTMTALPGGDLLVAGGCDVDGCSHATASTFVLSGTGTTRAANLTDARDAHTAVQLGDGRVLVVGGFAGEGQPPLRSAEVFDPASGQWTRTGSLAQGRGGHAAALLGDGRVLVAGGWVAPSTYTDTTEIFDPGTGQFVPGPRLPQAADGLAAASLADGCALVVGGQVSSQIASGQAVTICPGGTVSRVESLATARFKHGVVVLESGQVLVVGGTRDDTALLRSTEVFDPESQRFRAGPDLVAGRYKLTDSIVALPGDRAVVAGGGEGGEIVDVGAGSARLVEAFNGGRRSFSTLGVTQGHLVLVGGYDEVIRLTRTYLTAPLDDL